MNFMVKCKSKDFEKNPPRLIMGDFVSFYTRTIKIQMSSKVIDKLICKITDL